MVAGHKRQLAPIRLCPLIFTFVLNKLNVFSWARTKPHSRPFSMVVCLCDCRSLKSNCNIYAIAPDSILYIHTYIHTICMYSKLTFAHVFGFIYLLRLHNLVCGCHQPLNQLRTLNDNALWQVIAVQCVEMLLCGAIRSRLFVFGFLYVVYLKIF